METAGAVYFFSPLRLKDRKKHKGVL